MVAVSSFCKYSCARTDPLPNRQCSIDPAACRQTSDLRTATKTRVLEHIVFQSQTEKFENVDGLKVVKVDVVFVDVWKSCVEGLFDGNVGIKRHYIK